jgi:chaperonin cofactor prefoldin
MTDVATLGIKVEADGVVKATDDLGKLEKQAGKTEKKTDGLGKTSKKTVPKFKAMKGATQQLGYQIQDIAVQLGAGQNAMMVFGQQGSQIASIFGPSGAVLGAVIAVASALGVAFFNGAKDAKDSLAGLNAETENFLGNLDSMNHKQLLLARERLLENKRVLMGYSSIVTETGARLNELFLKGGTKEGRTREETTEFITLKVAAENAKLELSDVNKQLSEVDSRMRSVAESGVNKSLSDQNKELKQSRDSWRKAIKAVEKYNDKQNKTAEAIKRAIDPMYAHIQNVERLTVLKEEGRLTEELFAKAVIKSGEALNKTSKETDVAMKSMKASISDTVTESIANFKSLGDTVSAVGDMVARMIIKKQIADPFATAASNILGDIDFSSYLPSFNGGGFTGGGGRGGGIDGRGGFPAILHPDETVVDHTKGQQMSGQTANITFNVNAVDSQSFLAHMSQNKAFIVGAVREAFNRNGRVMPA